MASWKLVKLGKGMKAAAAKAKAKVGDPAPAAFELHVGEDGSVTIFGVNDQSNTVDISPVATLAVVANNPAVATADPPTGMTFMEHGVTIGDARFTCTATWNDGSVGPFSVDDNVTVTAGPPGPVTGLSIVHNPPTPH